MIAKEGHIILVPLFFITFSIGVYVHIVDNAFLSTIYFLMGLLFLFCINFFRDPKRTIPIGDNLIVSPADGKIVKVIDEMIKEYNVNDEVKNILLSFQETFKITIRDNRHLVKDLRDYKAYDFRMGAIYIGMLTAFHENEEKKKFYSKLVKDIKNPNTSIGKYNEKLKLAHENVALVKKEIEHFSEINDIRNLLDKVNIEISTRN